MTHTKTVINIPAGREGYIYLIHAEGTNRYKIGRSVNPIARVSDIQKQAPYPLKIIASAWTLDAPSDETFLHRIYSDWRIYGEWFDLSGAVDPIENQTPTYIETKLWRVNQSIGCLPTKQGLINHSITQLGDFLKCDLHSGHFLGLSVIWIYDLFDELASRSDVLLTQKFLRETLPKLIPNFYGLKELDAIVYHQFSRPDYQRWGDLDGYISGAIATFIAVGLNKGVK